MYALPTEMVVTAEKTNLGIVHVVQYVRVTLNTFVQCLNENRRNAINITYMYILCSKIIDNNILQQHHKERAVLTYFWLSKDTDLGFTMVVFKKKTSKSSITTGICSQPVDSFTSLFVLSIVKT